MLDSDQEPSYNLSKNLLLLPRILKLMKDMVDDSTPLVTVCGIVQFTFLEHYFCYGTCVNGTYNVYILQIRRGV